MMFSLSFVGGSKSAEGGPNPLADLVIYVIYVIYDWKKKHSNMKYIC